MKKMNKILSVMMAAAMTVSMTACGGDTASDNTSASADNSAATTESAPKYSIPTGNAPVYRPAQRGETQINIPDFLKNRR